ncbi:MAG TPA: metalloregulator ArsR/SmtB family transcription factor [Polyangiaceae bacterium]|nr:metalloregulator ArsR/SmtB family transcription factor [Polyangiaceae bacterium]
MSSARGKVRAEQKIDRVFHCLADPARRKIIALLREAGELTVGQVGKAFSMTQNGVSKHLKVLEDAGLVVRRVEGREHWISVSWSALQPAYAWLHFHHHFWSERLDALVDYAKKEKS